MRCTIQKNSTLYKLGEDYLKSRGPNPYKWDGSQSEKYNKAKSDLIRQIKEDYLKDTAWERSTIREKLYDTHILEESLIEDLIARLQNFVNYALKTKPAYKESVPRHRAESSYNVAQEGSCPPPLQET